jgi:hypothetical protein
VALAELQVVEGLEVEVGTIADLAEGDVVLLGLPVRRVRLRDVRERREELIAPLIELAELRLELLEFGLEPTRLLTGLRELGLVDLPGLCRLLDLTRELVLLGADLIDPGVELAAPPVDLDQLVQLLRRTPSAQRRADGVRIAADLLEVERGPGSPSYGVVEVDVVAGAGCWTTSWPAYLATKAATFCASAPTTMFCGMIAPEKPPLRIA